MANNLLKKFLKSNAVKELVVTELEDDKFLSSGIPSIDILASGRIDGGIRIGSITQMSADSSEGKSLVALNLLANAYKNGMECIYVDTENAFNAGMIALGASMGIKFATEKNPEGVVVIKSKLISDVKSIFATASEGQSRKERENTFCVLDSWGGLVSMQVMEKAEEGSSSVDMGATAKFKNELANVISASGITTFVVNQVYDSLSLYGGRTIPGGKRIYFLSDGIILVTSSAKDKDKAGDVRGKICTAIIKKGRNGMESEKVKYRISNKNGIDKWYGLLDEYIEAGLVEKSKPGYYYRTEIDVDTETGEITKQWKEESTYTEDFCKALNENPKFIEHIKNKFSHTISEEEKPTDEDLNAEDDELP
ncbi:MAG: hypothetical protein MJZ34_11225 [Paludibacteraceae bacterium]|nr:hypothetical protein [Paludibacteraceae bacterium]